jgi:hypothetical protein
VAALLLGDGVDVAAESGWQCGHCAMGVLLRGWEWVSGQIALRLHAATVASETQSRTNSSRSSGRHG